MKQYKFKLLTKRMSETKIQGVAESDFKAIWKIYGDFVSEFMTIFYGAEKEENEEDADPMKEDADLKAFYFAVKESLGIDPKFPFKRANVQLVMVHLICTVTAYNKHLNAALSA